MDAVQVSNIDNYDVDEENDNKEKEKDNNELIVTAMMTSMRLNTNTLVLPSWVETLRPTWGIRLDRPEWEDYNENSTASNYRRNSGWHGYDLCHHSLSPVRILDYYYHIDMTNDVTMTGVVYFSPMAESHKGYCHGGSMCMIMDDIIGWTGFLATGKVRPWSGYTVQVNTTLKKPIKVHSILLLQASIVQREGPRKVFVEAKLVDPSNTSTNDHGTDVSPPLFVTHATADGLVLLNKDEVNINKNNNDNNN